MTDWLTQFDSLDYPGRRKPLNRVTPKAHTDSVDWATKPLKYVIAGQECEFFSIGHLALALGYSVQSIRAWENAQLLPKSRYRSPNQRRANQPEHLTKGKRLWTREQIEGILRIASEEGVILNKKPPTARFASRVQALFNEQFHQTHQTHQTTQQTTQGHQP